MLARDIGFAVFGDRSRPDVVINVEPARAGYRYTICLDPQGPSAYACPSSVVRGDDDAMPPVVDDFPFGAGRVYTGLVTRRTVAAEVRDSNGAVTNCQVLDVSNNEPDPATFPFKAVGCIGVSPGSLTVVDDAGRRSPVDCFVVDGPSFPRLGGCAPT
ncbi:MAG: hypothetical protein HYX32_12470 [Actinobacteria bacterium]|nr:hypothetical protein [Actinomycetota bacterium]